MVGPARYAFKLDPSIPLDDACGIPDALGTSFWALNDRSVPIHVLLNGDPRKLTHRDTHWLRGKNVVTFGAGGIGGAIIRLATSYFDVGNMVVVDISEEKLAFAKSLGATHTVNSKAYLDAEGIDLSQLSGKDRKKAISGLAKHISGHLKAYGFQVDLAVDCSGADVFSIALETVSKHRNFIQLAWPAKPSNGVFVQKIMDKCIVIPGTWACTMEKMAILVKAVNEGLVDIKGLVTNKDYTLDTVEKALIDLQEGDKIMGRASIKVQ